jgi:ribose 5-phosphate isomerase B
MADEGKIQQMVRRIVYRTVGLEGKKRVKASREMVTELDIRDLPFGDTFVIPKGALVTPLARQVAMDRNIQLIEEKLTSTPKLAFANPSVGPQNPIPSGRRTIAIGADHGGYNLKLELKTLLQDLGYEVADCGTDSTASVDYPDFAFAVANLVAQGKAWRGVIIDGAGIGSCMTANKVPGVRAAMCYDQASAINSRDHNNANVLTLGAGMIGAGLARQILKVWLATDFGGGRHARRVDKITGVEQRYLKK